MLGFALPSNMNTALHEQYLHLLNILQMASSSLHRPVTEFLSSVYLGTEHFDLSPC